MSRSIGRLIAILYRKSQIYMNMSLKKHGITSAEQPVLSYLYSKDGVTQDKISSHLNIDKAATARAVQSLMEKGYVIKEKDKEDKRCNRIFLTERSLEIESDIKEGLMGWSKFLTEDMDKESSDFVYSSLEKMVEKIDETDFKEKWRDKNGDS